jgi:hypothetical protein
MGNHGHAPRPADWWRDSVANYWMRGVFHALCDCASDDGVRQVLEHASRQPWMPELARSFQQVAALDRTAPVEVADSEGMVRLWQLYAASRVRDVLLLAHQPPPADAAGKAEFDEALGRAEPSFGPVPVNTITEFFAQIGCRPVIERVFDPILHEIVACEPAGPPDSPIEVTAHIWPALLIGELVFARGGVCARAGTGHAITGVADRSTLNWEYWRRYRDTVDGSFWWGSNSQWKTEFRRDYLTGTGRVYNLDAASVWKSRIQETVQNATPKPGAPKLTAAEETEFIKNRCQLRYEYEVCTPDRVLDERQGRFRPLISGPAC